MTKREIVKRVVTRTGLSRPLARLGVDKILFLIEDALIRGERVDLRGFGRFTAMSRKAYMGRNPATGEALSVPAGRFVRFKPGSKMLPRKPGLAGKPPLESHSERARTEEGRVAKEQRESEGNASAGGSGRAGRSGFPPRDEFD